MVNAITRNISRLVLLCFLLIGLAVSKETSSGPIDTIVENEFFAEEVEEAEKEEEAGAREEGLGAVEGNNNDLDTDRDAMIFDVNQRKGGFTYFDSYDLKMNQTIPTGGFSMETKTSMGMESETVVQDLLEGGQSIDMTFTHSIVDMEAGPMVIHCDSDDAPSSEGGDMTSMACQPFFDMINNPIHIVIDDEGTIVDADGPGAEAAQAMSQASAKPDLATKNLQQAARLLKLVPHDVPVKPGQDWDASTDMGGLGMLIARGTLQGYKTYESIDCAVITVSGSLEMDAGKVMQMMMGGSGMPPSSLGDISVADAMMEVTLHFDYVNSIVRWANNNLSMTISMPDPLSPGNTVHVPTTQEVTTTSNIKEEG